LGGVSVASRWSAVLILAETVSGATARFHGRTSRLTPTLGDELELSACTGIGEGVPDLEGGPNAARRSRGVQQPARSPSSWTSTRPMPGIGPVVHNSRALQTQSLCLILVVIRRKQDGSLHQRNLHGLGGTKPSSSFDWEFPVGAQLRVRRTGHHNACRAALLVCSMGIHGRQPMRPGSNLGFELSE